ncbi:MAG: 4Fe-4S binding protein, partial [Gammaproteobacteria bacterium]|nr:4Fe-4S binding protein [Gammaproteobacteria bacterium]
MASSLDTIEWDGIVCQSPGFMAHPGLPVSWAVVVILSMLILGIWAYLRPVDVKQRSHYFNLSELPLVGQWIQGLTASPWPLLVFKVLLVALFLLVIVAGLLGTPIPERNIATALTWNLWWAGLIVAIFLLGSAWCGVCPWDALATWLVRRRWWRRAHPNNSLNLRVPKGLRNVWPALWMFIGLTWLELGVGVTVSPYATAALALLMVVLATVSLALFERKAFCRYFCPVGRTVGFYAQLAPVELRPIDAQVCADCTTLDCYHGNDTVEPCPTHLVMGRLTQNTYCTSCGNCTQSCPHQNISWRLRPQSLEAISGARPHWDEAWFML